MKNYYLGLCFLLVAVVSCRKVDDSSVFTKSADQRINEAITGYQAKLSGAQYGWKGAVQTKGGGNYTFYFSFNDSNRVKMLSSFDTTSASTLKESSYRLKALQQPSLLFDTYSYLHVLADPNGGVNGGPDGAGLISDFEFYFDDAHSSTDTIALVGRFNGSKTTLVRATQLEQTGFLNGELENGLSIGNIFNYFKRIVVNNTDSADAFIDMRNSYFIRPDTAGNLEDATIGTNFTVILGGISFNNPVTIGTKTITQIVGMNFDPNTSTITGTANGEPVVITGVVLPMNVNESGPENWWNTAHDNETYWRTWAGCHQNGVDDAFDLANLTATGVSFFYYFIYGPDYFEDGVDVFGPVFVNLGLDGLTFVYAAAPSFPVWAPNGIQRFRNSSTSYGTYPASSTNAARKMRNLLYQTAGFYFVKINNTNYDMVSALTGKSWVRWELQP